MPAVFMLSPFIWKEWDALGLWVLPEKPNHSVLEVFKQISTAWTTLLKVSKYNENDSQMQYWEKCNNKAS